MCMTITKASIARTKQEKTLKRKGWVWRYKWLNLSTDGLCVVAPYRGFIYSAGLNISNRLSTTLTEQELNLEYDHWTEVYLSKISKGFHVYHTKKEAMQEQDGQVLVRVKCYHKDLVCYGYYGDQKNAIYTRLTLPKDQYNKVLQTKCYA